MHANPVPEAAEEDAGDKNDPQADESMGEIGAPLPLTVPERSQDAPADEVAAENEEDEHGLVPEIGDAVGKAKPCLVVRDMGIVDEEAGPPVREKDQDCRNCSNEVKGY
jgi:hypothetical protein